MVSATGFKDDVALRLDDGRPMSAASVDALQALCNRAEDDPGTGLVVIHVSGLPDGGWTRTVNVNLVSKWERAVRRLERLTVPTAAVVSGDCGGPALDVLLATDFRVATRDARLVVSVEGDATWPGMSLYRLARQAGPGPIRRAALLGAPIDATEAHALRLVDEVVDDPAAALAALAGLADGIAGKELAIRRQLVFDAGRTSFEDALGTHLAACDRALRRGAQS
jgi:isomerase DpgB